jgi:hypothetical protein
LNASVVNRTSRLIHLLDTDHEGPLTGYEKLVAHVNSPEVFKSLACSPDCRHVAYVAGVDEKQFVVVDGKEQKHYDSIGKGMCYHDCYLGTPIFSPDSRRLAYAAGEGEKWFAVVDGKEQNPYDDLSALSFTFSPDGRRLAYWAEEGGKWFVVVDGKEGKPYDDLVSGIVFDSVSVFHFLAERKATAGYDILLVEETTD